MTTNSKCPFLTSVVIISLHTLTSKTRLPWICNDISLKFIFSTPLMAKKFQNQFSWEPWSLLYDYQEQWDEHMSWRRIRHRNTSFVSYEWIICVSSWGQWGLLNKWSGQVEACRCMFPTNQMILWQVSSELKLSQYFYHLHRRATAPVLHEGPHSQGMSGCRWLGF